MKYIRTYHLPWSQGSTSDDKTLKDTTHFKDKDVIATLKMDGENTGFTKHNIHARSLDSKDHPSRHWVKGLWGNIKCDIPENLKFYGENLAAKHSILYKNLDTYLYIFAILDLETNTFLSWESVKEWCYLLNLETVPILYEGKWNEEIIKSIYREYDINGNIMEGYVVRNKESFKYEDSSTNLAKFVRKNHVTSASHWMYDKIVYNELIKMKEAYFIPHCDDYCGMGRFNYTCPYCNKNVDDYDIWYEQDNINETSGHQILCESCKHNLKIVYKNYIT